MKKINYIERKIIFVLFWLLNIETSQFKNNNKQEVKQKKCVAKLTLIGWKVDLAFISLAIFSLILACKVLHSKDEKEEYKSLNQKRPLVVKVA